MEALGTLAGGIAHDFNNLLMAIQGNVSIALMSLGSSQKIHKKLINIESYIQSASELTSQLLGLARGGKYMVQLTDLNQLIQKNSQMFGRTKKEITIRKKLQSDLWSVEVDQGQIDQALLNLYVNAWQAMPEGGTLYIRTENIILDENRVLSYALKPGKYVKIVITDTGIGMDENTRRRIFDPFFTTKGPGRGTGLGLASTYGIIKNHEGIINVFSEKGRGARFDIFLPATEKRPAEKFQAPPKLLKGSETILLVDDEPAVIMIGREMMEEMGYTVFAAQSGSEAVAIYKQYYRQISLIILDIIMPEMGGGDTFDCLKEINPDVNVLLSSGYSLDGEAADR
jgi:K+-sensing histidine kinase KdpD/CheY-like chemotaxis protein